MKVYEAVAAGIAQEGVDKIFGVMGDGNMPIWASIVKNGGIQMISSGHEAGAVAMADGYSRATGKVGVATTTHGPGLTQIGTSLTVAVRNHSSMVLVIGQVRRGGTHLAQYMNQGPFVTACGARFVDVSTPENLAREMSEAFYTARVHRVPVVLNLDLGMQDRSFDWEFVYRPSTQALPPRFDTPGEDAIAALVDKLAAAERPVIIAGTGARQSGARDEILALGERMGALLATSLQAKGFFAGQEFDVGICGNFSSEPTERLLADADFVLGVGAEVGHFTSEGGMMFLMADIARIDLNPVPPQIGPLPGLYVCGDAKKTVALLNQRLGERNISKTGFRNAETRAILAAPGHEFPKPSDGLDPRSLARSIGAVLPKECSVTAGNAHFWSFVAMYMPVPKDAEMRFSYQFGSIGQTLPLAIGISAANPGRPHVVIEGDGAILMNIQELFTITRFKLNLVLIIWNDGGFGAEMHKLRAHGFDQTLAQWESADYVAIARAFGGDGMRIESERDIGPAIGKGLKQGGLYLIDARVSPTTVCDTYLKVHFGQPNQAPLLRPVAADY